MKYVRSFTKIIEEINGVSDIQPGFSGTVERGNHDLSEKTKNISATQKRYYYSRGLFFIEQSNVDENSLNKSLFHLSRYGKWLFSGVIILL